MKLKLLNHKKDKLQPLEAYWVIKNGLPIIIICCYKCAESATGFDHEYEIYEDGTISMKPSLVCPHCEAHYYVRKNEIDIIP